MGRAVCWLTCLHVLTVFAPSRLSIYYFHTGVIVAILLAMSTVLILLRSDLKAFEAKLDTMLETKFELLETKFERLIGSQERFFRDDQLPARKG